jgi:hypothetical protein
VERGGARAGDLGRCCRRRDGGRHLFGSPQSGALRRLPGDLSLPLQQRGRPACEQGGNLQHARLRIGQRQRAHLRQAAGRGQSQREAGAALLADLGRHGRRRRRADLRISLRDPGRLDDRRKRQLLRLLLAEQHGADPPEHALLLLPVRRPAPGQRDRGMERVHLAGLP